MSFSISKLRAGAETGAIVLGAAAIAVGCYAVLDFGIFSEDAPLRLCLVFLTTVLATGLAVAFARNRLGAALTRAEEKLAEREAECRRLDPGRAGVAAIHDPLTGLPNRALLFDRLQQAILRAAREKGRVAVMFIGLHCPGAPGGEGGERLLREVARRLATSLRSTDTVCRIGGDEFVVLLEDIDGPGNAADVAANLLAVIGLPLETGSRSFRLGAAIGIALYPDDGGEVLDLVKAADTALDAAREEVGSAFRFFQTPGRKRPTSRRSGWPPGPCRNSDLDQ